MKDYNIGSSDYSKHTIQPWDIIDEYQLNFYEGCIIKRILRTKKGQSRVEDMKKAKHELEHLINILVEGGNNESLSVRHRNQG